MIKIQEANITLQFERGKSRVHAGKIDKIWILFVMPSAQVIGRAKNEKEARNVAREWLEKYQTIGDPFIDALMC